MNYKQYTPREIAAFLTRRAAALVLLIQRGIKITNCDCGLDYIQSLENGNITTRAELVNLYNYIIDLSIGINRMSPNEWEKATAAALLHEAGGMADFLTAEEEDSRKTAASMLNTAAARHAAEKTKNARFAARR